MATSRITVRLPDDQIHAIRELVAAGKAASVSAFVKHAVAVALFDAAGWQTMLNDALRETGGPLTRDERKWADTLLHSPPGKRTGKKGMNGPGRGRNRAA